MAAIGGKSANLCIVQHFALDGLMLRLGPLFIAFCMAAIAVSLSAILVLGLGLSLPLGAAGGFAGLGLIALVVRILTGSQSRSGPLRLFEMEERLNTLSARLHVIDQRFSRLEAALPEAIRRGGQALEHEVGELGTLVRALAEQVELHEHVLADIPQRHVMPEPKPQTPIAPPRAAVPAAPSQPIPAPAIQAPPIVRTPPIASMSSAFRPINQDAAKRLRTAIESDGIELHLSPIAGLPQRRVIHYDTLPYLRDSDGSLVGPADFMADARATGLLPALDTFVLDRSLRVARRLKARERELSLFVNLAAETFRGDVFATEIARRLDANSDLASHMMLGFSQEALHGFGGVEAEMLATLSERGFRFVLTEVTNVSLEARALHDLGIRVVRVAADLLLDPDEAMEASIHPADLPNLLRRSQILLVADRVDTEARVADLLDLDVRAAQGTMFGIPRPVRPEVFSESDAPAATPPSFGGQRPAAPAHQPFRSIVRRV